MLKNSKVVVTLKSWSGRKRLDPTTYQPHNTVIYFYLQIMLPEETKATSVLSCHISHNKAIVTSVCLSSL